MPSLSQYWCSFERVLFPALEEALSEPLLASHREFVRVLDVVKIERFVAGRAPHWLGRPPHDRRALARAFLAKACFNFPTTTALLDRLQVDPVLRRLCGWETRRELPDEATFSRAFAEFAASKLLDQIHAALVEEYVGATVFWHVARDTTAIEARERVVPKPEAPGPPELPAAKRKRGRPRKDAEPPPPCLTRLERQYHAAPAQNWPLLAELPRECGFGYHRNAAGKVHIWKGYKLHVDVGDGGLPLLAVTTGAAVHDTQAAIPMARITAGRVTCLYELMDAGYHAEYLERACADLDHVPIIARNRRARLPLSMEPDRAARYQHRTVVERFNSMLKDNHGGGTVRVRGAAKVHTHLMFGVLVIFAGVLLGWAAAG